MSQGMSQGQRGAEDGHGDDSPGQHQSQHQHQSQSQNQSLLNLINACKSVDQKQEQRGQAPGLQGEAAGAGTALTLSARPTQLQQAVLLHQRCLARGGALPAAAPSSTTTDVDPVYHQEFIDAATLETWRIARSTMELNNESYGSEGQSAMEQALAYLDLHLPNWSSTPAPPPASASSISTPPINIGGYLTNSQCTPATTIIAHEPTVNQDDIISQEECSPVPILNPDGLQHQKDLSISSALIEASVATAPSSDTTTIDVSGCALCDKKRSSTVALVGHQTGGDHGAGSHSGSEPKRSRLDQQLDRCRGIISRFRSRGGVMPRHQKRAAGRNKSVRVKNQSPSSAQRQLDEEELTQENEHPEVQKELEQEYQDAAKLKCWKLAVMRDCNHSDRTGNENSARQSSGCPPEVRDMLDFHIPHWRDVSMKKAHEIVERYVQRGGILPREWRDRQSCPMREQEYQDANKLKHWKQAVKGIGGRTCSAEVCEYLDSHLIGWRNTERKSRKQKQKWQPVKVNAPVENSDCLKNYTSVDNFEVGDHEVPSANGAEARVCSDQQRFAIGNGHSGASPKDYTASHLQQEKTIAQYQYEHLDQRQQQHHNYDQNIQQQQQTETSLTFNLGGRPNPHNQFDNRQFQLQQPQNHFDFQQIDQQQAHQHQRQWDQQPPAGEVAVILPSLSTLAGACESEIESEKEKATFSAAISSPTYLEKACL